MKIFYINASIKLSDAWVKKGIDENYIKKKVEMFLEKGLISRGDGYTEIGVEHVKVVSADVKGI